MLKSDIFEILDFYLLLGVQKNCESNIRIKFRMNNRLSRLVNKIMINKKNYTVTFYTKIVNLM